MKSYESIKAHLDALRSKIKEKEAERAEMSDRFHQLINQPGVSKRDALKKDEVHRVCEALKSIEDEVNDLKLVRAILCNNARVAFYTENMPKALEVLRKYEGKVMGPKTSQKVNDEVSESIGYHFYIDRTSYIKTFILYGPSGERFEIYPNSGTFKFIDDENKLRVPDMKDIRIYNVADYVENAYEHAEAIKSIWAEADELHNKLRDLCNTFNRMIPAGIDEISCTNIRPIRA